MRTVPREQPASNKKRNLKPDTKMKTLAKLTLAALAFTTLGTTTLLAGPGPIGPTDRPGAKHIHPVKEMTCDRMVVNKPPRLPPTAPSDAYDYELTAHVYWGGELGDRRFEGFHADVLGTNGPLTQLAIWHGGTGKTGAPPAGVWWLDLAQVAIPPGAGVPAVGGAPGPVYLDSKTKQLLGLREPKRPPGLGE